MSATLGALLRLLEPDWSITLIERLDGAAAESSDPWNNAGTGHSALCELNYTPRTARRLDRHHQGRARQRAVPGVPPVLGATPWRTACCPTSAASSTPSRTSASCTAPSNVRVPAQARYDALVDQPAVRHDGVHRRPRRVRPPAAADGRRARLLRPRRAELDAGRHRRRLRFAVASQLIGFAAKQRHDHATSATRSATSTSSPTAAGRSRSPTGAPAPSASSTPSSCSSAPAAARCRCCRSPASRRPRASAASRSAAQFLRTDNPTLTAAHQAKVYGQPPLGAPPMSVPHLDTRVINGKSWLLFGPFAGWSPEVPQAGQGHRPAAARCKPNNLASDARRRRDRAGPGQVPGRSAAAERGRPRRRAA